MWIRIRNTCGKFPSVGRESGVLPAGARGAGELGPQGPGGGGGGRGGAAVAPPVLRHTLPLLTRDRSSSTHTRFRIFTSKQCCGFGRLIYLILNFYTRSRFRQQQRGEKFVLFPFCAVINSKILTCFFFKDRKTTDIDF
jgi:hypothetical protein